VKGRIVLRVLAGAYLVGVWLEGVGSTLPSHLLPRTAVYFFQVAALFPNAAVMSIDYRAEAWVCADKKWTELDTRSFFPLDPDDKENRFQRVMHFFREHARTMRALDAYLVDGHNDGTHDDGIPKDAHIGGVRLMSLRIPLPSPGEPPHRATRLPLADYPKDERHLFYRTPKSKRAERCGASAEAPHDDGTSAGHEEPE
jgi:hypothetical protein